MRLRVLIPALALAAALVAAVGASARPQATSIQIRTVLNAAQEVPSPTGAVSSAGGTFSASVTRSETGASVSWQLSFSGLTGNAIAAHIHTGAVGSPGPVVLALCGPCSSPASGTGALTQAALDAIQAGTAYVNVHTPTNAAGEIRGQLATTAGISTALSSRQEVPEAEGQRQACDRELHGNACEAGNDGDGRVATPILEPDRQSDRGSHPRWPHRQGRSGRRGPLRSVPKRTARHREPDGGHAGCAPGGTRLRERPHAKEPRRRDQGADPRRPAHDLVDPRSASP